MGRKPNPTMAEYLAELQRSMEEKAQASRVKRTKAKAKYNNKKYGTIQVFLDKELVEAFKNKVKELDVSQAEIIRSFIEEFLDD